MDNPRRGGIALRARNKRIHACRPVSASARRRFAACLTIAAGQLSAGGLQLSVPVVCRRVFSRDSLRWQSYAPTPMPSCFRYLEDKRDSRVCGLPGDFK